MTNTAGWLCRCPTEFGRPDEHGASIIRSGEWIQVANRWAAFTDDELRQLTSSFQGDIWGSVDGMEHEVRAEIERRKT